MHLPDGFLDTKTVVVTATLAAVGVGTALRQARRHLPPQRMPLLGLTAAFVFAAQMLNFPVAGGTSGHLLGGVLAAVLLGPSGAVLALSAVLIVQCFLFADGGVLALGANIFNMGIVAALGGYYIYRPVARVLGGDRGRLGGAAFAAWCATVLAAVVVAGELSVSGVVKWSVVLPAMAGVHMLIGIGEALITTLVILAVMRTRPELLELGRGQVPARGYVEVFAFGLLIALGLAMFVSPLASAWPDGLQQVAGALGLAEEAAQGSRVVAPMPGYVAPGIGSAAWATAIAGAIGTVVVLILALVLARALVPKSASKAEPTSGHR